MVLAGNEYKCKSCEWTVSIYDVDAEKSLMEIISKERVAFRNELRYRLEKQYYHTVIDYAIKRLEQDKAYNYGYRLFRTALPGRRSISQGTPNVFYKTENSEYGDVLGIMKKKLELSEFVSELAGPAGFHAQSLWRDGMKSLGYEILKEDVSEFEGVKVEGGTLILLRRKVAFVLVLK
jgi:hypothetical protein